MLDESLRSEIARLRSTQENAEGQNGEMRPADVESHFNRLSNLLNKLKSITDQAPDISSRFSSLSHDFELLVIAALREAECADLIEKSMEGDLTSLCVEIKQKDDALQARDAEIGRLAEESKDRVAELENRIRDQELQLNQFGAERRQLTAENDRLVSRLNEAELDIERAESQARQFSDRVNAELASARLDLENREAALASRESDLNRSEAEQKAELENLQLLLRDTEAKLAIKEKELNEKTRAIDAAALREAEIGKLIERLSSECQQLSAELCEKKLIISRFAAKASSSLANGGNAFHAMLRLIRIGRWSRIKES